MKKILIILMIFILSLTCVSASDDVNETLEISDVNDDVIADAGTFSALQNKINNAPSGSTISLDNDYTYNYDFDDFLYIEKTLTINGNGHTIHGLGQTKINFQTLTVNNLNFDNCMMWGNTLRMTDCNVYDCLDSSYGELSETGFAEADYMYLTNCKFTNNKGYTAGAVKSNNLLVADNCEFKNNYGDDGAGAITFWNSEGNSRITNCIFENNYGDNGGAIDGNGYISSCIFINNNADSNGGAIRLKSESTVENCRFINNTADKSGALYVESDIYHINNCEFISNTAIDGNGGAAKGTGIFTNCNFENNKAKYFGGALDEPMQVIACNFTNNFVNFGIDESEACGGAICGINENIWGEEDDEGERELIAIEYKTQISNSRFAENEARYGGAIYQGGLISNCEFIDNTACKDGNAICRSKTIQNSIFKSSKNEDNFITGTVDMILKNNAMTSNNNYDIKITPGFEDMAPSIQSEIYLVFESKTVTPNSAFNICEIQDDSGNNIIIEDFDRPVIKAKLTNQQTKEVKSVDIEMDEDLKAFVYECHDDEGTYEVTGYVEHKAVDAITIKKGILIVDSDTNYTLTANDLTKYVGGPQKFTARVVNGKGRAIAGVNIIITINGRDYTRVTDSDGVASMNINLGAGKYSAVCRFGNITDDATINVISTLSGNDLTKYFRNSSQYYINCLDTNGSKIANGIIEFNINGVFYTRDIVNGVARMNINLNPGEYIITAKNYMNGEQYSNRITVLTTIVENYDLVKYYKNASQYRVRLLDGQGKPVGKGVSIEFNINGVFYTRSSDENGYVNMNINLNPGTYIITANYNGLMASNKITVKPILVAKDLKMTYRDGSQFNVTLLDGQGKAYPNQPITFNINGVFYNRITDTNGIAHLNIYLMAGEYIITSTYENGAATSNRVTIEVKDLFL
ncbi:MAG: hypothetical protein J6B73_09175 [Methanobrevibacter sp.]|uniref:right-handed parallel beta-helix repeat-containing protein n=1 Tax=Methanobrevibacter sp. TaxID=66852 RepID=UPI001B2C563E|nr:right-handed parallel beta-helix repeat-containing protein [Methanobrevibacter sp.]MBO5152313.1 hypothetical protein [Methanobrevibacter sp.]